MPGGSGVSNQEIALTECEAGANRAILSKKRNSQKNGKNHTTQNIGLDYFYRQQMKLQKNFPNSNNLSKRLHYNYFYKIVKSKEI